MIPSSAMRNRSKMISRDEKRRTDIGPMSESGYTGLGMVVSRKTTFEPICMTKIDLEALTQ